MFQFIVASLAITPTIFCLQEIQYMTLFSFIYKIVKYYFRLGTNIHAKNPICHDFARNFLNIYKNNKTKYKFC